MNMANQIDEIDKFTLRGYPKFWRRLAFAWAVFLLLSVFYCHGYAWWVAGDYSTNLRAAVRCVARDWLLWAFISPLLIHWGSRQGLADPRGKVRLVGLLLACTLAVAGCRLFLEMHWGELAPLPLLFVYLPRYIFIAAFILLGGLLYGRRGGLSVPRVLANPPASSQVSGQAGAPPAALLVCKGNSKVLLPQSRILCISASGNYLELFTQDNCYLMRGTLKNIEQQLQPGQFTRVHRSHLVRLSEITSVSRGNREVALSNGMKLPFGNTYIKNLPHFGLAKLQE